MSKRSTGPVGTPQEKLIGKIKGAIDEIWGSADEAEAKLTGATGDSKVKKTSTKPSASTKPATRRTLSSNKAAAKPVKDKIVPLTKAVGVATKRTVAKKAAVTAKALRDKGKRT